jgi:soluble lytic murein transglycosylase-like protein
MVAACTGEDAGSPARARQGRPVLARGAWLCALLLACGAARPGHAGALYRCRGLQGETVFSGSAEGYRDCTRLSGDMAASPARGRRPLAAPAPPAKASLAGVTGSAETTAAPAAPPAAGLPGRWNYRESRSGLDSQAAADPVPAAGPGDRVLRGAVYRVVRADGSVEYTNLPPAGGKGHAVTMLFTYLATCMACNLHSPIHWDTVALNLTAYADAIRMASTESGVDEALLRAVIHAESAFNPQALSIKGAQGLMQLMPGTALDMGVRDAFDVEQNIRGGARYLAYLLKSFNGDEQLAAAAYNSGERAVQRYNGVPPYAETQVYVQRVGILRRRYEQAAHPPLANAGS